MMKDDQIYDISCFWNISNDFDFLEMLWLFMTASKYKIYNIILVTVNFA